MQKPRILYLTPCWPHDRTFGGQLRSLHIGRALQQFGAVTLLVVSADVAADETRRQTAAEFQTDPPARVERQPNRGLNQKLRWALDPRYLNAHGCTVESQDRQRLLARVADFDLVWLLNSRTPNIIQQWHWPGSVLDIDDLPSTYQRTVRQNGAGLVRKLKAGVQTLLLRRRERLWNERFTALAVCSEMDREYLGGGGQLHVIPNGFERPAHEPERRPVDPPCLGFMGLFSFLPNLDGVGWFLRECWPAIQRASPGVRLRLVGKDTDGPLQPHTPGVEALGWLPDPAAEIATWSATIIPIRYGAGTRIKLADAFSRKCPVVSTRLGAFGYDVQDERELLLADDPAAFTAACLRAIRDRQSAADRAGRAYQMFLQKWTWDAIAPRVWETAEDCLRRSRK